MNDKIIHFRELGCGDDGADILVRHYTDMDDETVKQKLTEAVNKTKAQTQDPDELVQKVCDEVFGHSWVIINVIEASF